ncbi:MAG: hypothetical protein IJW47_00770 [Clostridia bacterium]|nr:hypothetical protein [Clostridia bacterium]
MQDFNQYSGNQQGNSDNIFNIVNDMARQYDGKSQGELFKAIYEKAKQGKQNGTLNNAQIDSFAQTISPVLDEKQRKILQKIIVELKKI